MFAILENGSGSAAPPTMVLEENVRVSCISLPALLGGKAAWRGLRTVGVDSGSSSW